jgi:hypothetical protein
VAQAANDGEKPNTDGDAEAQYDLAVRLLERGKRDEAATAAGKALSLDPNHGGAAKVLAQCKRQSPYEPPKPLIGLGRPWTNVGKGLLALCVVETSLLAAHVPFTPAMQPKHDVLSVASLFLYVFCGLACVFWMTVDLIDRRERFLWLLPIWVCGLAALPALPLAFYLFVVRKEN